MIRSARTYFITELRSDMIVDLSNDRTTITNSVTVTTDDVNVNRAAVQTDILDGVSHWFEEVFHKSVLVNGLPTFSALDKRVLTVVFTSHTTQDNTDVVTAETVGLILTSSPEDGVTTLCNKVALKSSTEDVPAFIQLKGVNGYDYHHRVRSGVMRSTMTVECEK